MMTEPGPNPRHRLFFAVFPPPVTARQIAQSGAWFGSEGRAIQWDRLHVTIDILDDHEHFPARDAAAMIAAGGRVSAPPFTLALDQLAESNRSVALRPRLRSFAAERLHAATGAALAEAGLSRRAGYRMSPHMTLFYRNGRPSVRAIAPVSWRVEELVLVHSLLGRTRYEILGRWPLTGANDQFDLFGD